MLKFFRAQSIGRFHELFYNLLDSYIRPLDFRTAPESLPAPRLIVKVLGPTTILNFHQSLPDQFFARPVKLRTVRNFVAFLVATAILLSYGFNFDPSFSE